MIKLKEGQVWCSGRVLPEEHPEDTDIEIIKIGPFEVNYRELAHGKTYTCLVENLEDSIRKIPYKLKILATMKNTIKKQKRK